MRTRPASLRLASRYCFSADTAEPREAGSTSTYETAYAPASDGDWPDAAEHAMRTIPNDRATLLTIPAPPARPAPPALVLCEGFVGITIQPSLAQLSGGDDRVTARLRVLGRVSIRRRVAAVRATAALTGAQVDPVRSG